MAIEIHSKFKLNGISFDKEELKEVGYSLVKEGDPNEKAIGDFLLDWCNVGQNIEVQTSGSTGKPKLVGLKKKHMANSAWATGEYFKLKAGDSALLCIPAYFIAGKMMLVRAMVLGLQLDYVEPSSSPMDFVSKTYDFCAMVPLQLQNSLAKLDSIKTLIVGGAPISKQQIEKLQNISTDIYETYGMTETITHVAVKKINSNVINSSEAEMHFRALPDVVFKTDDRDCLIVDAPNILDAQIITNDIVHLKSETEFEWLGRFDNIINSGGVKLIPESIEAKLAPIIENRFFVSGAPDKILGQKLILLIEGKVDKATLFDSIKDTRMLQKFEIPKDILNVPEFVETTSGKINRLETLKSLSN
ncbi:AMP-binding protein [Maribacter halichondriae]|uniref:AMP-binding protein n=1 Tax=Maribacter halichondriae TaxID=2980554 RepID=UPI002359ED2A|nr:AMP-binding protein [Maribacter sp. Hal144]